MVNPFSKFQCGFKISATDQWKSFSELLKNLSEPFDCLPHEILITKLHAYCFSLAALRHVDRSLSNKEQKTKINESSSSLEAILFGVPQRSILGSLLVNIFICDLFIMVDDFNIANWADDNTPFVSGDTSVHVMTSLENAVEKRFEWFSNNHMKANHDKCDLLINTVPISIKVKDSGIKIVIMKSF